MAHPSGLQDLNHVRMFKRLRAQSDAILIGTNTALVDNPHLIPRGHTARPVRII